MKKMKQFVFYGPNSPKNFPKDSDFTDTNYMNPWKYNLFINYNSVSHLGIQGEAGIIFYLNNSADPISIGSTGIYELDLENIGYISALKFDMDILTEEYNNHLDTNHKLIVDIVYEGAE